MGALRLQGGAGLTRALPTAPAHRRALTPAPQPRRSPARPALGLSPCPPQGSAAGAWCSSARGKNRLSLRQRFGCGEDISLPFLGPGIGVMLLAASSSLCLPVPARASWPLAPGPRSVPNWLPSNPPWTLQCHPSTQRPELSEPPRVRSHRRSTPVPAPGPPPVWGMQLGTEGTLAPCLALHRAACASPSAPRVRLVGPAEQPPGALVDTE